MKIWLFVIGSAVIGVAIGLGVALGRNSLPGDEDPLGYDPAMVTEGDQPEVVVDEEIVDLGEPIEGARLEHTFIFSNHGTGTLELHHNAETDSTCKCTVGSIEQGRIPPGGQTEVKLTVTIEGQPGPFRQQAVIHTNDPKRKRVELVVTGRISRPVSPSVRELVIGRVAAKETGSATFRIYAFDDNELEILGHEFDAATASLFDATFTPLSADVLHEAEASAKSGYDVTVSLKPGLPLGPFQQTIRIRTRSGDVEVPLELPIRGSIVSDFYVAGIGWDPSREVLHLGRVHGQEGKKWKAYLLVRGPYRNEVRVKLHSAVPDVLRVTVGEPLGGDGKVVRIPLELEIPPGTPSLIFQGANLGGYGNVVLETTHPEVKQYKILISVVVEG